ncbi:flavin-dependent monooxygenase [Nocardia carnea]|uniref:flavin-dependent monooxygenase n=1 Tax=Nocardia carnea TaxID=37328 RepID=UPI002457DF54|nr:flavin-dependent monooxygenase [Nocardia carnea]
MDTEVAEAARTLGPLLSAQSAAVDADGAISEHTLTELTDAGLFRLLRPVWTGGYESDPNHFCDIVRTLSACCASTGWTVSLFGIGNWHTALFDERAQHDVWDEHPEALICSAYAPAGRFVPVEGGYELTGHWRFASGSAYATWALLGGTVMAENGQPVDIVTALVPLSQCRRTERWDAVGLRGSGIHGLLTDRVFVPDHRTVRNYEVALGQSPGRQFNTGPLYRMPYTTMYNSAVGSPVLGMAEGCLQTFIDRLRDEHRLSFGQGNPSAAQRATVGRAASDIDAAVLQSHRNLRDLYDCAQQREDLPMELRLRARRDQALAAERATHSVDSIFAAAGGTSLQRGNPIERAWRDVHTGSSHAGNDVATGLELYGQGAFGLPVDEMMA